MKSKAFQFARSYNYKKKKQNKLSCFIDRFYVKQPHILYNTCKNFSPIPTPHVKKICNGFVGCSFFNVKYHQQWCNICD